jgi:hypothetical protein
VVDTRRVLTGARNHCEGSVTDFRVNYFRALCAVTAGVSAKKPQFLPDASRRVPVHCLRRV